MTMTPDHEDFRLFSGRNVDVFVQYGTLKVRVPHTLNRLPLGLGRLSTSVLVNEVPGKYDVWGFFPLFPSTLFYKIFKVTPYQWRHRKDTVKVAPSRRAQPRA